VDIFDVVIQILIAIKFPLVVTLSALIFEFGFVVLLVSCDCFAGLQHTITVQAIEFVLEHVSFWSFTIFKNPITVLTIDSNESESRINRFSRMLHHV
jgi:hypothetical protein